MISFIDLGAQHREVAEEIRSRLEEEIRAARFILGPAVTRFEEGMARYHGVRHGIGVASGTDALLLSLLAADIGPGDEVITTPFTFVATAEVILHAGATPVFADIEEETFNLDPALVEQAVSGKTKAIIPVHLYGLPANMEELGALSARKGLKVIEDCAQAHGAEFDGKKAGTFGDCSNHSGRPGCPRY